MFDHGHIFFLFHGWFCEGAESCFNSEYLHGSTASPSQCVWATYSVPDLREVKESDFCSRSLLQTEIAKYLNVGICYLEYCLHHKAVHEKFAAF